MNTGTRANRKLAARLEELTREVTAAATMAAFSCRSDGYLRSAVKAARAELLRADKMLGLALEAAQKNGDA